MDASGPTQQLVESTAIAGEGALTLAEVLVRLETVSGITESRRRDLISAVSGPRPCSNATPTLSRPSLPGSDPCSRASMPPRRRFRLRPGQTCVPAWRPLCALQRASPSRATDALRCRPSGRVCWGHYRVSTRASGSRGSPVSARRQGSSPPRWMRPYWSASAPISAPRPCARGRTNSSAGRQCSGTALGIKFPDGRHGNS